MKKFHLKRAVVKKTLNTTLLLRWLHWITVNTSKTWLKTLLSRECFGVMINSGFAKIRTNNHSRNPEVTRILCLNTQFKALMSRLWARSVLQCSWEDVITNKRIEQEERSTFSKMMVRNIGLFHQWGTPRTHRIYHKLKNQEFKEWLRKSSLRWWFLKLMHQLMMQI